MSNDDLLDQQLHTLLRPGERPLARAMVSRQAGILGLIGMTLLGEAANPLKIASIALIVAGVVGLNLAGAH